MPKTPLVSRSPRRRPAAGERAAGAASAPPPAPAGAPQPSVRPARPARWRGWAARHPGLPWAAFGAALALALVALLLALRPPGRVITQEHIDAAVRASLEKEPLPSAASKAYQAIAPSVVRVVGSATAADGGDDEDQAGDAGPDGEADPSRSVGTGVVIIDNGTILTNLHVVQDARRIRLRFHDGTESEADLVGTQPENDLAVLRARRLPDDLQAATMRSAADLLPGDEVIAVGHPFGIGPSVSAGVVSGLRREFQSPEGERELTNLIQFDAAANPGNSGGPLVTMDGQVVGIVTAILNPSEQRTFIGIGFAVPIENAAQAAGLPPF